MQNAISSVAGLRELQIDHPGSVLVVDDENAIRGVIKQMLEMVGYRVLTAGSGREGVRIFRQHSEKIMVVLLDLKMPDLDGEATFKELRRIDPGVRAILMSGLAEEEAAERFSGIGLSGFLHKPFQLHRIIDRVREYYEQILKDQTLRRPSQLGNTKMAVAM